MKLFKKGLKNTDESVIEEVKIGDDVAPKIEGQEETKTEEPKVEESAEEASETEEPKVEESTEEESETKEPKVEKSTEEEVETEEPKVEESTKEESELEEKSKNKLKIALVVLASIFGVILTVYIAGAIFFNYHFLYNTTLNDTNVSFKSVKSVHGLLNEKVTSYKLTIVTADGSEEVITGNQINIGYKESKDVALALDLQMPYKWPMMFFKDRMYTMDVDITFNEDILKDIVNKLEILNPIERIEPINAYPTFKDGNITIIDEVLGNQLNENAEDIFLDYVYDLKDTIVLVDAKAYVSPSFTNDCIEIQEAITSMNTLLNSGVNYTEGEVIDEELIGSWILVDQETLEVSLSEEKISEYVKTLEDKYNTYSTSISFTNPVGKKATVSGGSFGDRINASKEVEQIITDIQSGAIVNRDIKYSQTGSSTATASNPFGESYVCLDLTLQKVYLLYKNSVILTSDVVTGSVAAGNATPQGVYYLTYKTKNAVLRGSIQSDGSYGYESPVSYWMPFNGGIGFHDASWRSTYGGTIYKNNGSHGCVNMPLANAAKLYEYINSSMPIVCHY